MSNPLNGILGPSGGGSGGDLVGPASSTDNAIARYDGTTGKLLQNSTATLDDNNALVLTRGVDTLTLAPLNSYNSSITANNGLEVLTGNGASTWFRGPDFGQVSTISDANSLNVDRFGLSFGRHSGGAGVSPYVPSENHINIQTHANDELTTPLKFDGQSAWASAATNLDGGEIRITGGNGASGSAGAANGGNVYLGGGTGYGTGTPGFVSVRNAANSQATNIKIDTQSKTLAGATTTATGLFPAKCVRLGVTYRVTTIVTSGDGGTSFNVGDGTDADLYGATIAFAAGTTGNLTQATANPTVWASAAGDVVFTCVGGTFSGGVVRVSAHYIDLTAPTS